MRHTGCFGGDADIFCLRNIKPLHQLHLYRLSGNNLAFYCLDVVNFEVILV